MACFSCSEIVLNTHNKLEEIIGSLTCNTCPCVLEAVLQNLKHQQLDLVNILLYARQECTRGLIICDLDTILNVKFSRAILTVIELLAVSHAQKETGSKAPQLSAHFDEINLELQLSSSDSEEEIDPGET